MKKYYHELDHKTQFAISQEIDIVVPFLPKLYYEELEMGERDLDLDDVYVESGKVYIPQEYEMSHWGSNVYDDPDEVSPSKYVEMFPLKQALANFEE